MVTKYFVGILLVGALAISNAAPTCYRDCDNPGGTHGDTINNYGPAPPKTSPPPPPPPQAPAAKCVRDCMNPDGQHGDTVNNNLPGIPGPSKSSK